MLFPDTGSGPKGYFAHGLTRTDLHGDITDAVNILFHAAPRDDGTEGGALWIMIHRDDMALAERLLRKLKAGCFEGHPIHAQVVHLTVEDVDDLRRQKVRIWTFIQRQGDAVFIPAGVGHQVGQIFLLALVVSEKLSGYELEFVHQDRRGLRITL